MLRIHKRAYMPVWARILVRLAAILAALVINGLIIYSVTKMDPIKVYETMFNGVFGSDRRIWSSVRDIMMLLCIGVGLAPAFKMKFWNIGAEGQILLGGIASAACMIYFKSLPNALLLLVMLIASAAAGGLWSFGPAIAQAKLNANETLFTLMMNYIAIHLTSFFVTFWENSYGSGIVGTLNADTQKGWFPPLFGQNYGLNVVLVLMLVVAVFLYLRYTKQGYEIAVVGESENTARYSGIRVPNVYMRTMAISSAVCGFAGFLAVTAISHTISLQTAGGRGFTAIIVAWLAKMNPFVMIIISLLLTFMSKGAIQIASDFGLNEYVSQIITGIILFFILGCEFFLNYRIHFGKQKQ